jgi:hypothetical protein
VTAQRLTSFDQAASAVGRSWENSSPSLSSLAFASAHQRQASSTTTAATTEARAQELLRPEEEEAAVTLQRMTTPDLYGISETGTGTGTGVATAKGIAESASASGVVSAGGRAGSGQAVAPAGRLPPSSSSLGSTVITGGGELRRMASIFSTIDDTSMGLSRGNSMEAWTMYAPPSSSSSSSSSSSAIFGKREREIGMGTVEGKSDKKKQMRESNNMNMNDPTSTLRRIQSQQQASVARMDSLEQSLSLIDDVDWRDIISPRESIDHYTSFLNDESNTSGSGNGSGSGSGINNMNGLTNAEVVEKL